MKYSFNQEVQAVAEGGVISPLSLFVIVNALCTAMAQPSFAAHDWCIQDPAHPPCGGRPGRCTINSDGSEGGFVADTAHVQETSQLFLFRRRNVPHIGINVQVCDSAEVLGNAEVVGAVRLSGKALIYGNARVSGQAVIRDEASIGGSARVYENSQIYGKAHVFGNAHVYGEAHVYGNARVYDDAHIYDSSHVYDFAWIHENARVSGEAHVFGFTRLSRSDVVGGTEHVHWDNIPTKLGIEPKSSLEHREIIHESGITISTETQEITDELKEQGKLCLAKLRTDQQRLDCLHDLDSQIEKARGQYGGQELKIKEDEIERQKQEILDKLEACPICFQTLMEKKRLKFTRCGHLFCEECFARVKKDECPMCREDEIKLDALDVTCGSQQ